MASGSQPRTWAATVRSTEPNTVRQSTAIASRELLTYQPAPHNHGARRTAGPYSRAISRCGQAASGSKQRVVQDQPEGAVHTSSRAPP